MKIVKYISNGTNTYKIIGEQGPAGSTGAEGKSAYQSVKEGGYTGTEKDFNKMLAYGFSNIRYLDYFPSSDTIKNMDVGTYFVTSAYCSGYYGSGTRYRVMGYANNALVIEGKYIKPYNQDIGVINVAYYGIRPGSGFAESNSNILESINNIEEGSTILFPAGHFYFKNPIDLTKNQLKIQGANHINHTPNLNDDGCTWLHFPELTDGQSAIITAKSSVANVIICGNEETYNITFDRKRTYSDTNNIVSVVSDGNNTTGINALSHQPAMITNCVIRNFTNGINLASSNSFVNNNIIRDCETGIIASVDIKINSLLLFEVMTGVKITGSNVSINNVRGDNIGKHLIHIVNGDCVSINDIDGDYCLESLIKIGDESHRVIKALSIINAHGRYAIAKSYDYTTENAPTFVDITSDEAEKYPLVYIAKDAKLHGCNFVLQLRTNVNPLDYDSNYRAPEIAIVGGINSSILSSSVQVLGKLDIDNSWINEKINTFSNLDVNIDLVLNSGNSIFKLSRKNRVYEIKECKFE